MCDVLGCRLPPLPGVRVVLGRPHTLPSCLLPRAGPQKERQLLLFQESLLSSQSS